MSTTPTPRPAPAAADPLRVIADHLAQHYDGQPLAELRDEHAAHHLEAAARLLPHLPAPAPAEPTCPAEVNRCMPHRRYGCGHCPHTDCQNPDCGHCPCKCDCR